MSFPRYPKYKDSGVEWLGEVPEHWSSGRLRYVSELLVDGTHHSPTSHVAGDHLYITAKNIKEHGFDLSEITYVTEVDHDEIYPRCPVKKDDVLYIKDGATAGIAMVNPLIEQFSLLSSVALIRPIRAKLLPRFVAYHLNAGQFKSDVLNRLVGGAMTRFTLDMISRFVLSIPPIAEQAAIAGFLDRETAKIDELVAEQRRLIELLKEKRQAVISHAVTKGLNPNAPMKPTGIEWLGDVPEHWELRCVKHYFQTASGGTPDTSRPDLYYADETNGIPWVRTTDLTNDVVDSVPVYITEKALNDTACEIMPTGTVMIAMYGGDGTVGKNGLLMIPAAINQAVCGLLPNKKNCSEFVFRFMQYYRPYWMIGAESSRKDPNISQERVRNAPFLRPPINEQDEIVAFLKLELVKLDTLTAEAERAIGLLQERRTALISAAVTGKIDVRGLVKTEVA